MYDTLIYVKVAICSSSTAAAAAATIAVTVIAPTPLCNNSIQEKLA